ncbi:hypothetical protein ACFOLJ_05400 [Rugamonas sp. CCM 8940]|uniref:hypothetical protein n=1 Tax=Rugamonas sp. CCM 8940 TaxID=2765359 RepID=UPI0018F4A5DC|nr:hypothetical protein [Rugamonas sp. CCM 8940]MBJ7311299.1 hypothetical protein [Rugamonas sp. CCM 8940]
MDTLKERTKIGDSLIAPVNLILDRQRGEILSTFVGKSGDLTHSILNNEETLRRVADYCHEFLPWPLRLTVKKPIFVEFVLSQRHAVLAQLAQAS